MIFRTIDKLSQILGDGNDCQRTYDDEINMCNLQ